MDEVFGRRVGSIAPWAVLCRYAAVPGPGIGLRRNGRFLSAAEGEPPLLIGITRLKLVCILPSAGGHLP